MVQNNYNQHSGTKTERAQWSKEKYALSPAFAAHLQALSKDQNIICIDDILTTGATFSALRCLLEKSGYMQVTCFALCYTELNSPAP